MPKAKTVTVTGLLKQVTSQRTPYKPYGYTLEFDSVRVEIELPEDVVVVKADGLVTINLDGLNHILQVTADSVDKLQREYEKRTGV